MSWQEEFTPGWHGYPGSDGSWSGYNETYSCDWDCYIEMFHTLSATLHKLYDAELTTTQQRPLLIGPCEGMVGWNAPEHAVFFNFTTQACAPLVFLFPLRDLMFLCCVRDAKGVRNTRSRVFVC